MKIESNCSAVEVQNSTWQQRWAFLIDRLTLISCEAQMKADLLPTLAQPVQPTVVAFINAHALNSATHDVAFAKSLSSADYLLRDGIGMCFLLKLTGKDPGLNLNGTDFIPQLIKYSGAHSVALFGTVDPYLSRAASFINPALGGSDVLIADGFLDEDVYVNLAKNKEPELIVLGMGMPKQEYVAQKLKYELNYPCLIVCGGAIIDFMGGKVNRAPGWVRSIGFEWLYRFVCEPKRLFYRYMIGNPAFILRSIAYYIRCGFGAGRSFFG